MPTKRLCSSGGKPLIRLLLLLRLGMYAQHVHRLQQRTELDGWIETLDWVLQQDVDVIDVGHYTPATKEDEQALRSYMVDLHQQVDLVRQGQAWDELYRNVRFADETKTWIGYDQMRIMNVMGMYRWAHPHRRGEW
jgi:hypothetical protein